MVPCECGYCSTNADLRQKHDRWRAVFATLNEHQARLFAANQALDLGTDGPAIMARITGLSHARFNEVCKNCGRGFTRLAPTGPAAQGVDDPNVKWPTLN